MGVRPGYKLTEAGVIPEEWELSTVGRQFSVQLGKMLDVDKNRGTHKPYIGNRHVQWGRFDLSDLPTIALTPEDLAKYRLVEGDLLVCEGGEVGRSAIWNGADTDCYYQKALHRLRPIGRLNTKVMLYLFEYLAATGSFADFVTQTSIAHLPREKLVEVRIPLPSLHEQRAIAAALTDVDDLLTSLDRLIAKKRAIKQGVMHDLLTGRKRLPGFSGEWEVRRLGDLARMASGGTPPSSVTTYYGGTIPWVSIADMTKAGKRLTTTIKTLSQSGLDNSAAQMFPANIVLYAMYASLGECSIAQIPVATSQAILGIEPGPALDYVFLYYHLLLSKDSVRSMGQHGTQANLNKGMVQDFQLNLPSLHEQRAIATVLTDMDDEIDALQSRRDKTHAIKQAMMAELLTGRTRLI